ncbi:MAG: NADH-quinone oxidoreductase subunit C [Planctomycetota bacterium]|jgi:NADH-quinone oxidoreductase subunit C
MNAVTTEAMIDGLSADDLAVIIGERFAVSRDPQDHWGLTLLVSRDDLRSVVRFLRDDERLRFDVLVDITAIDYLAYPDWRGERFGVVYLFKSMAARQRLRLKVLVDEGDELVPSLHDLYRIADWQERETFDQYGIRFTDHPNLKRLLNHHEFEGHPLRKDYPAQKRQKLSINDPMVDQLCARLDALGHTVLELGVVGEQEAGAVGEHKASSQAQGDQA